MVRPTKTEAIRRLEMTLGEISNLKRLERNSPAFDKWKRDTRVAIASVFGTKSDHVAEFAKIRYFPSFLSTSTSEHELQQYYIDALDRATALLMSMKDEIEEYWEDENHRETSSSNSGTKSASTDQIFIIHGRDNETKETVARFLEHLDLKPIILHEQSNQGRTIIEKFEQYAQVGFAVALLTPDDVGALQEDRRSLKPRARQNVIFEFGYFIGRLGRERVCALTKGDIEIPSDYEGVIYIPLDDSEGWKMKLVKEFKNAGLAVDANRAF